MFKNFNPYVSMITAKVDLGNGPSMFLTLANVNKGKKGKKNNHGRQVSTYDTDNKQTFKMSMSEIVETTEFITEFTKGWREPFISIDDYNKVVNGVNGARRDIVAIGNEDRKTVSSAKSKFFIHGPFNNDNYTVCVVSFSIWPEKKDGKLFRYRKDLKVAIGYKKGGAKGKMRDTKYHPMPPELGKQFFWYFNAVAKNGLLLADLGYYVKNLINNNGGNATRASDNYGNRYSNRNQGERTSNYERQKNEEEVVESNTAGDTFETTQEYTEEYGDDPYFDMT